MFARQFLLNYSPGVVRENKFSYKRVEEHHEFIVPNDTIGCLLFTHSATHPMIWYLLFLPKNPEEGKFLPFLNWKVVCNFLSIVIAYQQTEN